MDSNPCTTCRFAGTHWASDAQLSTVPQWFKSAFWLKPRPQWGL